MFFTEFWNPPTYSPIAWQFVTCLVTRDYALFIAFLGVHDAHP
jgi:hypothetical protein